MPEFIVALVIFLCLVGSSLGCLFLHEKLPERYRQDETNNFVRQVTSVFVVMTSLVLGLMINSAKTTFESIDHNVHVFATDLILLDRMLAQYGSETSEARQHLQAYVQRAVNRAGSDDDAGAAGDRTSERLLDEVGASLGAMKPGDTEHTQLWRDIRQQFQKVVEMRWTLVEQSEGTVPVPLLVMLVTWLALIFASLGFRAPRNLVIVASLFLSAALIAGAIYLILDMDVPFAGPIQVSSAPLERVIQEMQR